MLYCRVRYVVPLSVLIVEPWIESVTLYTVYNTWTVTVTFTHTHTYLYINGITILHNQTVAYKLMFTISPVT